MSLPREIRERYAPRSVKRGEPLPKPVELEPVRKPEKQPRTPLNKTGAKHASKKAKQFGEQSQRCREAPCCCCGVAGVSEPHHWPTRAAGGLDADTCPLCPECHAVFHGEAGSPEAFLELMGCDVLAEIEKMRRGARLVAPTMSASPCSRSGSFRAGASCSSRATCVAIRGVEGRSVTMRSGTTRHEVG